MFFTVNNAVAPRMLLTVTEMHGRMAVVVVRVMVMVVAVGKTRDARQESAADRSFGADAMAFCAEALCAFLHSHHAQRGLTRDSHNRTLPASDFATITTVPPVPWFGAGAATLTAGYSGLRNSYV